MTTTTTPSRAIVLQTLKMLAAGTDVGVIADATGLTGQEIQDVGQANGWPDQSEVQRAIRRLQAAPMPVPAPARQQAAVSTKPAAGRSVEDLIDDARSSGDTKLNVAAERVVSAVTALRTELATYAEVAEQRQQVEQLEKELARAKARAGIQDKAGDKLVRAWAKRKGMEVAERGRLSRKIRDAYVAAHAGSDK